jgi:HEAT repeat protein
MLRVTAIALLSLLGIQDPAQDQTRLRKLIEELGADFLEERESARRGLEKAGAQAEALLIEGLGHPDYRVRRNCLELLTTQKSQKALARSAQLFQSDEDASVKDAAFKLLQALGKEAEEPLIAALDSPSLEHRRGAIQTLSSFKSQKCAEKMAALHDREQDKETKGAALSCLKGLGKPAEAFLLKYLASTDPVLRREALEGLGKSASEEVLQAVGRLFRAETDDKTIDKAFEYLQSAGARSEAYLLEGLKSPQELVRKRSIEGLGSQKSAKALEPISDVFLNDPSEEVRKVASGYLKGEGARAETSLVRGLSSSQTKVKLLAIEDLAEIQSDAPLKDIARLFHEDKDKQVHRKSFDYLCRLGIRAEHDLILALDDEDKEIRRLAIIALGNAKSEVVIDRLIDFLTELDPVLKSASVDALVRIGPKAIEALDRAVEAKKLTRSFGESVLGLYYQEEVERILDGLVTANQGGGYFPGQFEGLEKFGRKKALPVLRRIVAEKGYSFRLLERRDRVGNYEMRMRELAVTALGESGDPAAVEVLREALHDSSLGPSEELMDETLMALYRLGDQEPLLGFLKKSESDAASRLKDGNKDEACSLLMSLGRMLHRLGRYSESEATYRKMIQAIADHKLTASAEKVLPPGAYNLACLLARRGEKREAIEWLEKSVKAGYRDRDWMRLDKDLDALRQEEGFRRLLANDKLFEGREGN